MDTKPGNTTSERSSGGASGGAERVDVTLGGELPCIRCGYDLQGLSVRGVCPECGTRIGATVLFRVDPLAEEFAPVSNPGALAWAVRTLPVAGLVAILGGWIGRTGVIVRDVALAELVGRGLIAAGGLAVAAGFALAIVCVVQMVRLTPNEQKPNVLSVRRGLWLGLFGLIGAGVTGVMITMGDLLGRWPAPAELLGVDQQPMRLGYRVTMAALLMVAFVGLAPAARLLTRRAIVLREGRVGRQPIRSLIVALAIWVLIDVARRATMDAGGQAFSSVFLGVASLVALLVGGFLTLGLINLIGDAKRMAEAIKRPPRTLGQVLGGGDARDG